MNKMRTLTKEKMKNTLNEITHPGIYPKELKIYVHIKSWTRMFIIILLIMSKHGYNYNVPQKETV